MAEIPVERKQGGLPWWLPILLLLLLIPLLFFLLRGCSPAAPVATNTNVNGNANRAVVAAGAANANNIAAPTNTNVASGANANSGANAAANSSSGAAITDAAYFGGVGDKMTLVGRGANFSNARVERVLSDRVFTVKSGAGEMFMMLNENLDSGGGKEQQIKIRPGQNLNVGGTFRTVPTAETKDEAQNRDLNQKEYAQMKGQQVYLQVNSVSDAK